MKLLQPLLLVGLMTTMISCPRPQIPEFCPAPKNIVIQSKCYDSREGLTLAASSLSGNDQSVILKWNVYVLSDSLASAPFNNPRFHDVVSNKNIVVPDSILQGNQKVYVSIQSECSGYPQDKAPGQVAAAFIRRYNKASNCYQWIQQPF